MAVVCCDCWSPVVVDSGLAAATGSDFGVGMSEVDGCESGIGAVRATTVPSDCAFCFALDEGVEGAGAGVAGFDATVPLASFATAQTSPTGFSGVSSAALDTT